MTFSVHVPRVAASNPLAKQRLCLLKETQEDLQFFMGSAQESQEKDYNRHDLPQPDYKPDDQVMLIAKNIRETLQEIK
ncbi:hypothetical protein BGW42_005930 [Actinomortierella wolfii]|nr:hypothetical protein BGW42_005930 [Actinomortierella wolfii]